MIPNTFKINDLELNTSSYNRNYYEAVCQLNISFFKTYHKKHYGEYKKERVNKFIDGAKNYMKILKHKNKIIGIKAVENKETNKYLE